MQNLTVIITFIIVSVIVGLITFFKTKETALETSDGYFLGGRSLPAFVIAGSLLLTNLSSVNFVGMSEQAYNDNMCVMGWEVCSGVTLVLVALILLPRYLKQGITTIPQFIESRFDKGTREFVTVIFLAGYILNMLPITLYSGAVAMSQIFNIPEMFHISYEQGIWAMVLVCGTMGAIYAVFGGFVTFVMIAMYIVFSPAGIASKRGFSSITVLYIGITAVCCLVVSLLLEKRQKHHTARRRLQQKKTKEISNPV